MRKLAGSNVLITGGSKGIGLSMASEFARRGANLALLARGEESLREAGECLRKLGTTVVTCPCDVTQAEALKDSIGRVCDQLGGLDGIVANSGYCHPGYFEQIPLDEARRQIDANLMGCVNTLHHSIPHLLQRGGGFIAISSSPAGEIPVFGFSVYGATKAALNNLARVIREEYADRNISVHLLLPPDTDTPGYREEIKLYPRETRAILESGKLFDSDRVARSCVEGIERNRKEITVGLGMRIAVSAMRLAPWLWDLHTRRKVRSARQTA
jgi:3-dehydrosphinganine reductase